MVQELIELPDGVAVSRLSTRSYFWWARLERKRLVTPAATNATNTAATAKTLDILQASFLRKAVALMDVSDNASSANARSDADWKRCSGFFSRQRCTTRCNAGGTLVVTCENARWVFVQDRRHRFRRSRFLKGPFAS